MDTYLVNRLNVPRSRIQRLVAPLDEYNSFNFRHEESDRLPTRAAIIETLIDLIHNEDIEYGDNIIVYYSGHGSRYPCNTFFSGIAGEGYVEVLCPMDRGGGIFDITDREFNVILSLIRLAKGPRITVILDCCHAGGTTRQMPLRGAWTWNPHFVDPLSEASLGDMLIEADQRLHFVTGYKDLPGVSVLREDFVPDMASHVVLAACEDFQLAGEAKINDKSKNCNGVFTWSLLDILNGGTPKEGWTYISLKETVRTRMASLIISGERVTQSPVVAGKNKDHPLWYKSCGSHGDRELGVTR